MVKWVADLGANHNQSLDRIYDLIEMAKDIGCWAVKFQLYEPKDLYRTLTVEKYEELLSTKLPVEFIEPIKRFCKDIHIKFGCTPFSIDAVDILKDYVDYFKISSYEILRRDLIEYCSQFIHPIHISTGMANLTEISEAFICAMSKRGDKEVIIYHCRADYPAAYDNCELYKIKMLARSFNKPIGWSDHTVCPGVIYQAIIEGAEYIEFHLDLDDMLGHESDYGHCWKGSDMMKIINNIKIGEDARKPARCPVTMEQRNQRADPIDGKRPRIRRG